MPKIDAKQIDLEDWNDHKCTWLYGDPAPIAYYPLNETTFQLVRKDNKYAAIAFKFDSRTKDGGVSLCDGREHKITYKNDNSTSVEIKVGLSPYEESIGNCTLRDTIGTIILNAWNYVTIYFYWVIFGGVRTCIIHHVIT